VERQRKERVRRQRKSWVEERVDSGAGEAAVGRRRKTGRVGGDETRATMG
jgi:hypothetical protein